MKRLLIIIAALVVIPALVIYAYLALGFYEPENIEFNSITARLTIPAKIRNMPIVEPCSKPQISKSLIECGGICGEIYTVEYSSRADLRSIENGLKGFKTLKEYRIAVFAGADLATDKCRRVRIELSRDDRDAV